MNRNGIQRLLVYVLMSLTVGLIGGVAVAAQVTKSPHPQDWVNPETGVIDFSKVPDRVKFSTDLSLEGYGWIDSGVLFGEELKNDLITIYVDENGSSILGYNDPETGAMFDAAMRLSTGQPESTVTTVSSFNDQTADGEPTK